jgi:hypothetical protein
MSNQDNGRAACAEAIMKAHNQATARRIVKLSLDALSPKTYGKGSLRKFEQKKRIARQILKAVTPERIGLKANGITDASLKLIKIAQANGTAYDPDMMTKLSLPPQSLNGTNGGPYANTGASNNWADETADGDVKPTRVGGQVIGTPAQSNIQATVDAIKAIHAKGPKRGL